LLVDYNNDFAQGIRSTERSPSGFRRLPMKSSRNFVGIQGKFRRDNGN